MSLKKRASKSIAIALVGISMITPILNTVHANEVTELNNNTQVDLVKEYDEETRLGGGPSPSAAWTYNRSYSHTFTASQLNNLSAKYQGIMNSSDYTRGKKAYDASVTALGYMGKGITGSVVANVLSLFGKTYHSEIQRSANVLATAASKKKSVTLKVKEYVRPANGAKMILFY